MQILNIFTKSLIIYFIKSMTTIEVQIFGNSISIYSLLMIFIILMIKSDKYSFCFNINKKIFS